MAFNVWGKPWNKTVSFNDFCNYILPYRAQSEPLSGLRKEFMSRYLPIVEAAKATSPLTACIAVNEQLKKEIKYAHTGSPLYPTIEETYYSGISQCDGLCNLGIAIMRAVGIPVAVDHTLWSKFDLGHSWGAVLDNKTFYSFGPGEDNPINHGIKFSKGSLIPVKVYRVLFKPSFEKPEMPTDKYRSFVKNPLNKDVTQTYKTKLTNIRINTDKEMDNAVSLIYLCLFNQDTWQVIAQGKRVGNECTINNVASDNVFIVADSPDGYSLRYLTAPFYVDSIGNVRKFIPNVHTQQAFTLKKRNLKLFQPHTLSYWDNNLNDFTPLSYSETTDSTQSYTNIPENALLRFTIPERIFNQRIFFIEKDASRYY